MMTACVSSYHLCVNVEGSLLFAIVARASFYLYLSNGANRAETNLLLPYRHRNVDILGAPLFAAPLLGATSPAISLITAPE